MTHASVAGTDLEVPDDLIRLSVGIETADDLVADLDRALGERARRPGAGRAVHSRQRAHAAGLPALGDRADGGGDRGRALLRRRRRWCCSCPWRCSAPGCSPRSVATSASARSTRRCARAGRSPAGSAAHLVSLAVLLCLCSRGRLRGHAGRAEPVAVSASTSGSTFTKAALVDAETGAAARRPPSHRTTIEHRRARRGRRVPCRAARWSTPRSSTRRCWRARRPAADCAIAVVGNEELVTAEAGRRVALSSGGKVVAVLGRASPTTRPSTSSARTTRPDVVLLIGGTDGGDEEAMLDGARPAGGQRLAGPGRGGRQRRRPGTTVAVECWPVGRSCVTDNVVPRIGVLAPELGSPGDPRDVPGARDRRQGAEQPRGLHRDGARRDARPGAHRGRGARRESRRRTSWSSTSAERPPTCTPSYASTRRTPGSRVRWSRRTPVTRTVEGDLGMRWSAVTTWEAGRRGRAARRRAPRRRRTTHGRPVVPADHRRRAARGRADRRDRGHPGAAPARRSFARRGRSRRPGRRAHRQGPARGRPARRLGRRAASRDPGVGRPHPRRARRRPRPRAGSCPSIRAWSSTTTTCSLPSACSSERRPRRGGGPGT